MIAALVRSIATELEGAPTPAGSAPKKLELVLSWKLELPAAEVLPAVAELRALAALLDSVEIEHSLRPTGSPN